MVNFSEFMDRELDFFGLLIYKLLVILSLLILNNCISLICFFQPSFRG
jgi:hypothetical protein